MFTCCSSFLSFSRQKPTKNIVNDSASFFRKRNTVAMGLRTQVMPARTSGHKIEARQASVYLLCSTSTTNISKQSYQTTMICKVQNSNLKSHTVDDVDVSTKSKIVLSIKSLCGSKRKSWVEFLKYVVHLCFF